MQLKNGTRLRYAQQGFEGGQVILMLHGYSDSSFSFSRILPLLPSSIRLIVPDQRGHGDSDRPPSGYSPDDFASDALQLLDALQIKRATIVGHSMGSFVARRIALLAADRVERLVLVGAGPACRNATLNELWRAVDALRDPVDPAFIRGFQGSTVHRPVPASFMEHVILESRKVPAHVWKSALTDLMNYTGNNRAILHPTLVLGGDRDAVFSRAEQEELARQIPGAILQIVPDVGHALHWEDPDRFAAELLRFVASGDRM